MEWTHRICTACWTKKNPNREPFKIRGDSPESLSCCFCGGKTVSGIYVREDPLTILCQGNHEEDEERKNAIDTTKALDIIDRDFK